MKGKATPVKQQASQGGRVMRQEREKASVKNMDAAKSAAVKKPSMKPKSY